MIISRNKQQYGFTIIELLVIIVVIGVLAGLVIAGYTMIRRSTVDASIESDLRSMADLQELYRLDNPSAAGFVYPNGPQDSEFAPSEGNTITVTLRNGGYCIKGYNSAGSFSNPSSAMTYDSLAGGLNKTGNACEP